MESADRHTIGVAGSSDPLDWPVSCCWWRVSPFWPAAPAAAAIDQPCRQLLRGPSRHPPPPPAPSRSSVRLRCSPAAYRPRTASLTDPLRASSQHLAQLLTASVPADVLRGAGPLDGLTISAGAVPIFGNDNPPRRSRSRSWPRWPTPWHRPRRRRPPHRPRLRRGHRRPPIGGFDRVGHPVPSGLAPTCATDGAVGHLGRCPCARW